MTKDMTSGNPLKLIIGFAIPMFLGMLFQQFYSMVDTVIVGKFLGVGPLAGVGSTSSLNFLVIGFCTGVCNGFAIPVSQMFGAKRDSELRRFVANSAWLCVIFSVVITTAIVACCRPLLTLMHTPEDIFEYAYVYIVIIFLGIPTTFLYNVTAAIIRSLGDSRSPVVFLAIASGINIVLDIVFIVAFHMGVEGPALATVISQGISGLLSLFYMKKKFEILRISKEEWKMRGSYMKTLCYMGIPMGLQYSVTAIGTLIIQATINGFGSMTVAGVTAAQRINAFISCPIEAIGATMAPYSGQNMGAGKLDRVGKGLRDASLLGFVISAVLFVFVLLTGKQLSLLFLDTADAQVPGIHGSGLLPSGAGQHRAFYDSGYGFFGICNHIRCAGNDCTITGRFGSGTAYWIHRHLSGTSDGMDFCRCLSDSGVFLLQKENCGAVQVKMYIFFGVICLFHRFIRLFYE